MAQELNHNAHNLSRPDADQISRENQISRWIFIAMFFVMGWLGATIVKTMPDNLLDVAKQAWKNQYLAGTGRPGDPRTYYLISGHMDLLIEQLLHDPDVAGVERTPIDRVSLITIRDNYSAAFNRIRKLDHVEAMMTIPLFCH